MRRVSLTDISIFIYKYGDHFRTQTFLYNPFDTLSKLLLQMYTYKLKYGLQRNLLRQNICHWHRCHPAICYKSKWNYLLDNSELTLLRFGLYI